MKTFKRIAIAGGALVLLGIIVFVIGMSVLDWDFARLSTRPPYVEKALEFDNDNQSITLDDKDMRIKIGVSPDEKIRIVYYEREKELYEGQYDEGNTDAISFVKKMTYKWYERIYVVDFTHPEFTLLLPSGYSGELNLKTDNGSVNVEGITCDKFSLSTSNGRVTIKDVDVSGDMSVKTSNGRITIENITAANITSKTDNGRIEIDNVTALGSARLETSNGKIKLSRLSFGTSAVLNTSNGDIEGSIVGSIGDFSITSKTTNGDNDLPGKTTGGAKSLEVRTSNGDIEISFVA